MDQIFEIAFRYYTQFYSYKGKVQKLWLWLLLSAIFGVGFVVSIGLSFPGMSQHIPSGWSLFRSLKWVLLFEILFLASHEKLKRERDKLLTIGCAEHPTRLKLIRAKRKWIKNACNKSEFEYSDFIREIKHLREAHKMATAQNVNWRESLLGSIYTSEAKPRITSYIIFSLSLISLLSIKNSEGLSEVIPTLLDESYQGLVTFILVLSCVIFFLFIGAVYLLRFSISAIDTWFSVAISAKRSTYRFVDLFVADLAAMHRLPSLRGYETEIRRS